MLQPHSRTIASPFGLSLDLGLRSSHLHAKRLKPFVAEHFTQRPWQHRDLTVAASDGVSNTSFAIEAPGDSDDVLECQDLRDKLKARLPLCCCDFKASTWTNSHALQCSCRDSPFQAHDNFGGGFASDGDRVALQSMRFATPRSAGATCMTLGQLSTIQNNDNGSAPARPEEAADDQVCVPLPPWAVRAGARETIYHDPSTVNAAIVTCGGLCPGLNDVVQGLVRKLEDYGVPDGNILGIRYGYKGFYNRKQKPVVLNSKAVEGIQLQGGTILGTSRGGADIKEIVKRIDMWGIDMLFVVGGNGGNAGAAAIQAQCEKDAVVCNVVGVPKSIDNDILVIDKCFGFDTAVEEAQTALLAAKVEASSADQGIGLVKLMGRSSGFIAMQASMASGVVDVCLIPEVNFAVDGEHGLMAYLKRLLAEKGHCVICVAEGAGQEILMSGDVQTDLSGNPILKDVGPWLKSEIKKRFKDADVKYIDPSYLIRSIPTTSNDRIYCKILAHNAVHAAFAGFTGVTVGLVNTHYVLLPIPVVIQAPRRVDPQGKQWNRLRSSIGQPQFTATTSPAGAGV